MKAYSIKYRIFIENYQNCTNLSDQKCNSIVIDSANGKNEEECKEMCNNLQNSFAKCNFIFWNNGQYCALYQTCDEFKTANGVGYIYAKDSCPGSRFLFIANSFDIKLLLIHRYKRYFPNQIYLDMTTETTMTPTTVTPIANRKGKLYESVISL